MKNLRSVFYCVFAVLVGALVLSSCKKDNDDDGKKPPVVLFDGFYVVGEATAIPNLQVSDAAKALMANALNEDAKNVKLDNVFEKYVALEGGKSFTVVKKAGSTETSYGATLDTESIDGRSGKLLSMFIKEH